MFGSSGNELEEELKTAAAHEEEIKNSVEESIEKMENYEELLFKEEEKENISPEKASRNLKSILVDFEKNIQTVEEGKDKVKTEIKAVKEDLGSQDEVSDEYVEFEQRMEKNLELVDEVLEFVEQEQDRLDRILSNVMQDIEDGRENFAMNKIQKVEEVDSERLQELQQKFEEEWSPLLN